MRARDLLAAATVATASALVGGGARAAVVSYIYEGTVGGDDHSGIFGAKGRSLSGLDFVAVFRRDGSVLGANSGSSEFESYIEGYDADNPITASLTIDGVTWNFRPEYGRQAQEDQRDACGPGCDYEVVLHEASATFEGMQAANFVYEDTRMWVLGEGLGANVLPNQHFGDLPSLYADLDWRSEFSIFVEVIDTTTGWRVSSQFAEGSLYIEKLTVMSTAVPEPATWALMILGFGGAGAMLRRRRSFVAA